MKGEHDNINDSNAKTIVEIQHLKKSFGSNQVLIDINLRLKKGENLVLLGRSGSGKSVLLKCLTKLIDIDEGTLIVYGKNIANLDEDELSAFRKKTGFLFQGGALYDSMTVRENLEFPLKDLEINSESEITELVEEALNNVGLIESINKMPFELSGGMRKRVALARTLILKPEIMLYDEPTTGLDPITSKEITNLLMDVQKKYDTSSIVITHDIVCAKTMANRIMVLKDGRCVAEGTFSELEKSEEEWVRSFFNPTYAEKEKVEINILQL